MPNSPKFPYGMYGAKGDIYYTSMDLSSDGTKAAIGGLCGDTDTCGSNAPNPIISLVDTVNIAFLWKLFVPTNTNYSKVLAIKLRLDNNKIAVVIDVGSSYPLTVLIVDPANGAILYGSQN